MHALFVSLLSGGLAIAAPPSDSNSEAQQTTAEDENQPAAEESETSESTAPPAEDAPTSEGEAPTALDPADMAEATPAPLYLDAELMAEPTEVDSEKMLELKPERHKMEQNPYEWRPWAAYALEWGEARVGLGSVALGLAPRVEVGSQVPLNVLGVYNGRIKVDAVRAGPLDLAAVGALYTLPRLDFSGRWVQAGGLASVRLADPVTFHLGARWGRITASGLPSIGNMGNALSGGRADELNQWIAQAQSRGIALNVDRTAVTTQVALDWRFNRRDSLVLQASATPWASGARSTEGIPDSVAESDDAAEIEEEVNALPPILFLDQLLSAEETVSARIASSYVATLAYQASYKNATLRLGVGVSALPYAWLMQSSELAFHFGGKTRSGERRMRRGWRNNRRELRRGGDEAGGA